MSPPPPIALVVHGHFYQPPRENPWTDDLEREPSAAPQHDWNARINAECYRANAFARIHDAAGRIEAIVNNYARMSFNFGPTLARWLGRSDPDTHQRLRAADAEQRRRFGRGGAIAQAYAHPIVPLLSPRDRQTQLLWGLLDFRQRFGREAEGLWLPETAVHAETLEALIDLGVRFTILAPEQIAAVRPSRKAEWAAVDRDSLDTGRAYRWLHGDGSGRSIDIAVFDGPLSRSIAFGDTAGRAESLLKAVHDSAERSKVGDQRLVLCASDGELFGHHKKFADLTLAFATYVEAARKGIEVTNLAAYLERHPPSWEVKLVAGPDGEGTAWSCSHGVGRWRRDCGCSMGGPSSGWNQKWRGPLRDALDLLRDAAAGFYEDAASELLVDPWGARDAYGEVVDARVEQRDRLLADFARPALAHGGAPARDRIRLLLELQRATLLMYSSCGWFFDDVAGLESSLVIRFAAHAMDLLRDAGGAPPLDDFLARLGEAKSNLAGEATGADVFRRVAGDRFTSRHAVGYAGLARLIGAPWVAPSPAGFDVEIREERDVSSPAGPVLSGRACAVSRRTGVAGEHTFLASQRGPARARLEARVDSSKIAVDDLGRDRRDALTWGAIGKLLATTTVVPDLELMRLALAAAPAEQDGRDSQRGTIFATLLMRLLGAQSGDLSAEAVRVAVDLLDAANLPADHRLRRRIEELVWEQIEAGADPRAIAPLVERLGFSPEAVGAEVKAS
jgi:alpha-amylase/alpha-mannosidase (GH57 family)